MAFPCGHLLSLTSNMKTGCMKIAQVALLYESVPPKLYGGVDL